MSNKKYYIFSAIFTIGAIITLITSRSREDTLFGVLVLLFFGVGAIICFIIDKREKSDKHKPFDTFDCIITMACSSVFAVVGYLFLPFHQIFDDTLGYNSIIGWTVGLVALIFGVLGFVAGIIHLIKNRLKRIKQLGIQMSNKGLTIANKSKTQFIEWKDIREMSKDDLHFIVYYQREKDKQMQSVKIALGLISQYDIGQIESYINHKISEHKRD